ncbi:MAG TPA: HAD-IIA family hydrolase [Polyangiaceae bacterium]|jgi:HAD superfamily hydrolase (TIGR01450 family)|nr:HAD-IIA family hydrolase [Polyangiaceae bacterium]
MSPHSQKVSFSELAQRYKVLFFDAYGVLKSSSGVIAGVTDVLAWLGGIGKDIYVVTNDASRSPQAMAHAYTHPRHGELIGSSRIISSGLLAKEFLRAKVKSGKVAYFGKPAAAFYIESAGLEAVSVADCRDGSELAAFAFLDDEGFDWFRDLNSAVNLLRKVNIPVVIANSDLAYPVNGSEVGVAVGSLATMVESIVAKTFVRFGKPDAQMFSYAFACAHANDETLTKADVLMVGDTLKTDILGANAFGIDTALVLSGNTPAEAVDVAIAASGIIPTYVCDSIVT